MRIIFSDTAKKLILLCLGFFLFILFFHQGIETEDVWWHLSLGRWIIDHAQIPHVDIFPFADEKTPWICHEWLGSTILYLVFKVGGFLGLKLFRSLLFMSTIGIFFGYSYRRLPFSFLIFLVLLMSYGLFQRSLLRPDVFNPLFVEIFLISLFSYERTGACWKLFILPLVGVFWLNLHIMGAFIYGGAIIFIFLLTALIKYLGQKKAQHSSDAAVDLKKQVKELTWVFLVYLAAFVINPYGIEGLLFPYKVILFPQFFGFYKMINVISEYQSSVYIFFSFQYFYFILLMAGPVLLLFLTKKRDLTLIFLFLLALVPFLCMTRNSSFFTVVAAYVIVRGAQNIGFTKMWAGLRWSALMDGLILVAVTICFIVQTFNLCNENVFFNGKKHRTLFFTTNPYVTSTIDLLKDNGIGGGVFNGTLVGGSIIWFAYPQLRPFDDGRHLDHQRYNDAINVLLNPEKSWHQAQRAYGFKIAVLSQGNSLEQNVIKYLNSQNDWQLIGINGPFVIYVKRGAFHLSDALNQFQRGLQADVLTQEDIKQLQIMSQRRPRTLLEQFFDPSPYRVAVFSNGVTLMRLGYKGAAAKDFIEALKISDQPYMQEIVSAFLKQ